MLTKHGSFCWIITKQTVLFIWKKNAENTKKATKFKLVFWGHLQKKELSKVKVLTS